MDDDTHKAVVNAHGVALATLAVLLHRKGALEIDGFAKILGLQATMTAQSSAIEGDILGMWAAYLEDAADSVAMAERGAAPSGDAAPVH